MPLSPRSTTLTTDFLDDFAAFQRLVVDDAGLFAQPQNAPTTDDFVTLAIELGALRGLTFDAGDVRTALLAALRAWIKRNIA